MTRYLRYTTFAPGELERRLRELSPHAASVSLPGSVPTMTHSRSGAAVTKAHAFTVTFPDQTSGTCRYERRAPKWHRFDFAYGDGEPMPWRASIEALGGGLLFIERKGQELARMSFDEAVERERREYFCRATEPKDGSRKRRPDLFRLKAGVAKENAGKYALCGRIGDYLRVVSPLYETLERANEAWRQQTDRQKMVVACCNRLDRCWEVLKFNPLYAEIGLRDRRGRPLELVPPTDVSEGVDPLEKGSEE